MELEDVIKSLRDFRDRRNWLRYHTPKNLALSIIIESTELLELFQWTTNAEEEIRVLDEKRGEIAEEIADILIYLLYFCDVAGIDLEKALREKIARNEMRFPLEGK